MFRKELGHHILKKRLSRPSSDYGNCLVFELSFLYNTSAHAAAETSNRLQVSKKVNI
jgi:hypothetical protein